MEETETAAVRWYKNTPSVPYMGIREYYEMLFGERLDCKNGRRLRAAHVAARTLRRSRTSLFEGERVE